jgi:hypothetical protein
MLEYNFKLATTASFYILYISLFINSFKSNDIIMNNFL